MSFCIWVRTQTHKLLCMRRWPHIQTMMTFQKQKSNITNQSVIHIAQNRTPLLLLLLYWTARLTHVGTLRESRGYWINTHLRADWHKPGRQTLQSLLTPNIVGTTQVSEQTRNGRKTTLWHKRKKEMHHFQQRSFLRMKVLSSVAVIPVFILNDPELQLTWKCPFHNLSTWAVWSPLQMLPRLCDV